jgi:hypothetical protein
MERMDCRVLDEAGRVVGSGATAGQAIAAAARRLGRLPWDGCDGPTAEEVVTSLIANGDYSLVLPWRVP